MLTQSAELERNGLEVVDIAGDEVFRSRRLHSHNAAVHLAGVKRIARAFMDDPDHLLQDLVESAVDLCGADSAAISLIKQGGTDREYYQWVGLCRVGGGAA